MPWIGLLLVLALWIVLIVLAFGLCQSAKRGDEMAEQTRRDRASWRNQ
jgi:hypothetical protein